MHKGQAGRHTTLPASFTYSSCCTLHAVQQSIIFPVALTRSLLQCSVSLSPLWGKPVAAGLRWETGEFTTIEDVEFLFHSETGRGERRAQLS